MAIMDRSAALRLIQGLEYIYDEASRAELVESPWDQWPELVREHEEGKFWFGVIKAAVWWSGEPTGEWV